MSAVGKWAQRVGNVLMFAYGVGIIASMIRTWPKLQTTTGHVIAGAVIVGVSLALVNAAVSFRRRV